MEGRVRFKSKFKEYRENMELFIEQELSSKYEGTIEQMAVYKAIWFTQMYLGSTVYFTCLYSRWRILNALMKKTLKRTGLKPLYQIIYRGTYWCPSMHSRMTFSNTFIKRNASKKHEKKTLYIVDELVDDKIITIMKKHKKVEVMKI